MEGRSDGPVPGHPTHSVRSEEDRALVQGGGGIDASARGEAPGDLAFAGVDGVARDERGAGRRERGGR